MGKIYKLETLKHTFFFLLLLLTYLTFSQTNADSLIIKNRVKKVRVFDINNKLVSEFEYDSIARLIYRLHNDFTGFKSLKSTITKIYDSNDNNIISVSTHSNFNKPIVWRYEYDNNGSKTATLDEFGNYVFRYFYDKNGFMVKKLSYNAKNEIRRKSTFEKADNGKKIIERMGNDSIISRINTVTIDDKGNTVKRESLDGTKINSLINNYYKNNRLVKITYYGGYGKNYFYNQKGRLIKIVGYKEEGNNEITNGYEEFIYNELGLIEKYIETKWSNDNSKSEYRYEYDFHE